MTTIDIESVDRFAARRATVADGLLEVFNAGGVLRASDVHVALRLGRAGGETREDVLLAAALAVRAVRLGSVLVDLATVRNTAAVDAEELLPVGELPWPEPREWQARVWASPLTGRVEEAVGALAPLRLEGERLYLDRYWQDEVAVAADLLRLDAGPAPGVDESLLEDGLGRLFPDEPDLSQRAAAAAAIRHRLALVAGGPGTGKTWTIGRVVALLAEQAKAGGNPPPLIAFAAPTAKAAARLRELVHASALTLPVAPPVAEQLRELEATTLHRLLGWRPGSRTRFRHHRGNPLPHDVVVIDETSMVSLPMMARVLEAVRPDARLLLVGDPDQLASVEAGAVLGDIVGPARERVDEAGGSAQRFGAGIAVLRREHRYGGGIARVAEAVRQGDATGLLDILRDPAEDVAWLPVDFAAEEVEDELHLLRELARRAGRELFERARSGDAGAAVAAMRSFMLLCAHRRGPYGVGGATSRLLGWLSGAIPELDVEQPHFIGEPLLVTENDYELRLFNGETGVVVARADGTGMEAVFDRDEELLRFTPTRLNAVERVYAMTIHKAQGSQFGSVAVVVPPVESRILTRELLYTAVTRAERRLLIVGTEEMVVSAVEQPMARASGLRERLWGADGRPP